MEKNEKLEKLERSARMHSLRSMISYNKKRGNVEAYKKNRKEYLDIKKAELEKELSSINEELETL